MIKKIIFRIKLSLIALFYGPDGVFKFIIRDLKKSIKDDYWVRVGFEVLKSRIAIYGLKEIYGLSEDLANNIELEGRKAYLSTISKLLGEIKNKERVEYIA